MLHFFAVITATIGITAADATTHDWQSDYATALKQTRSDDRPLLMVIDQPGVANKCLSDAMLKSDAKGALADYDLCHVDASTIYGKKVAAAFKTESFPYVAFIDKAGKVILHQQTGEITSDEWTNLVGKYRTGEKPVRRVVSKPVVKTSPVSTSKPASSYPTYNSYQQYMPASPRPYCAKCQRGY